MKIAFVKDAMSTGRGADRAVAALMNGLAGRGHDISFVTLQAEAVPFSVALNGRISVLRVNAGEVAKAADGADVIVSTGTNEILLLEGAAKPIVQQFHTSPASCFKWRHPLRNLAIRRALARATAVQILLPGHLSALPSVLRARATVIGNAPTIMPVGGEECPPGKMIVYPAALSKGKNHDLLIRAFAEVAAEFPEWTLELYGSGKPNEAKRLECIVAGLGRRVPGLGDRVRFMGYRNLHGAYARCAFLAFPSRIEGFGLAIVEAASFGKPAIGLSSAPGVNELILDGRTGLLVRSDVAALADGMRRLMSDDALRLRLGEEARAVCRSRYDMERILDSWESLLGLAVRKPPAT